MGEVGLGDVCGGDCGCVGDVCVGGVRVCVWGCVWRGGACQARGLPLHVWDGEQVSAAASNSSQLRVAGLAWLHAPSAMSYRTQLMHASMAAMKHSSLCQQQVLMTADKGSRNLLSRFLHKLNLLVDWISIIE